MTTSLRPMGGGGGVMTSSGGRGGSSQESFSQLITTSHNNRTSSNKSLTYKPSSSDNNNSNSNTISLSSNHHHPVPYDDHVFATVPSMDEVNHAFSSLKQVVDQSSTSMLQPRGSQSVYDAFRLLQTETCKKMVVSLASDKSVWEAVMKNEAVREFRDSVRGSVTKAYRSIDAGISAAYRNVAVKDAKSSDGSTSLLEILGSFFINMKAIAMEVLENIIEKLASNLFQSSPRHEKNTKGEGESNSDKYYRASSMPFEKEVEGSLFWSFMVMLIVIVIRISQVVLA